MRIFQESIGMGLAAVILWVGFWTVLVPQMPTMQVWQHYESVIPHLFVVVSVGYMPARLLLSR